MSAAAAMAEASTPACGVVRQLHPGQLPVWQDPARFVNIAAGRRWGKSELGSMMMLVRAHEARLRRERDALFWIVTPTYRQTRPIWRKINRLAPPGYITGKRGTEGAPDTLHFGPNVRVEFRSAKVPESLVAEGLRGVWMDECGTIAERAWSESIRPTLLDHGGWALFTGTPKGRGSWFHRNYLRGLAGERGWSSHWGTSADNPWLAQWDLEEMAEELPERIYQQEILAQFIRDSGGAFEGVDDIIAGELTPPIASHNYVAGIDLALKQNWTVVCVYDTTSHHVAAVYRFKRPKWSLLEDRIVRFCRLYGVGRATIDATGLGGPVYEDLATKMPGVTEPFIFGATTKNPLIENLMAAIDRGKFTIPRAAEQLLVELYGYDFEFTRAGKIRYFKGEGLNDDCVDALALALWSLRAYRPVRYRATDPGREKGLGGRLLDGEGPGRLVT